MKKLRLLFTKDCEKNCKGCCNKDWDLDSLLEVDHFNYDEILITGGEPMLYPLSLIELVKKIRLRSGAKIILYTAKCNNVLIKIIEKYLDGVTVTLHEQSDVQFFKKLNKRMLNDKIFLNKFLRLNIFKNIKLPKNINLSLWKIKKNIEWVKNCPLPKNEEFKKVSYIF